MGEVALRDERRLRNPLVVIPLSSWNCRRLKAGHEEPPCGLSLLIPGQAWAGLIGIDLVTSHLLVIGDAVLMRRQRGRYCKSALRLRQIARRGEMRIQVTARMQRVIAEGICWNLNLASYPPGQRPPIPRRRDQQAGRE